VKRFLSKLGKNALYHFTDRRNLDSIRTHGILALAESQRRGIEIPAAGGNEWSQDADRYRGFDEYVHLCFTQNHPMEYRAREEGRIENVIYLEISNEILLASDVKVCTEVANTSGSVLLDLEEAFDDFDWDALYGRLNWKVAEEQQRRKAVEKYEVLVPGSVPLTVIRTKL
jgi:hypothetical protein